ncbi:MAG TPA: hypothetical protein VFF26_10845 [Gallionella sp.]|nr:hypothetical protein [Gallionella sp.]
MMGNAETSNTEGPREPAAPAAGKKKRANMHEGIAVWCDCCSCEAEPYWAELAEEMGMTFSDYEDEPTAKKNDSQTSKSP